MWTKVEQTEYGLVKNIGEVKEESQTVFSLSWEGGNCPIITGVTSFCKCLSISVGTGEDGNNVLHIVYTASTLLHGLSKLKSYKAFRLRGKLGTRIYSETIFIESTIIPKRKSRTSKPKSKPKQL